jgi:protein-S-isoprenylcysteine O-methyltransferase Ste14
VHHINPADMKTLFKYIIGYIIGTVIFIFLIPYGFYELSKLDIFLSNRSLIGNNTIRYIISSSAFLIGAYFMLWSNVFLFKTGKGGPSDAFGVSISPRTKKLVTTGPYRFSRNPMVFGALSLYTSVVVFSDSIPGLAVLLISVALVIIYLKSSEEKRLLKDFGEEYWDYRKKVSMILPIKRSKK